MPDADLPQKLRLLPESSPEELGQRFEREKRALHVQREFGQDNSIAPFRAGSVPYLNAVPLTRSLEEQLVYSPPSQLAEMLRKGELDAALVSATEVLLNDCYDVLDGIAIASLGEVKSVILAHRRPLAEIQEVFCDTASLSSVLLLRVLLAEQGLKPQFKPLPNYESIQASDYVLLIGDIALDLFRSPGQHQIYDLGAAWFDLTKLPFVYAVWALRRGIENAELRRRLRAARDFGLETLDYIIGSRTDYDYNFRKDYLSWNIHYFLGADEKRGIAKFMELLVKHGLGPVHQPQFV